MAEAKTGDRMIVDSMKNEGQLTRNSGTNSIKSLRVDFSKFNDVFKSIDTNLTIQSNFLESIYNIQSSLRDMAVERNEDSARLDDLSVNDPAPPPTNDTQSESNSDEDDKDKGKSLFSRLFSGGMLAKLAIGAIAAPFVFSYFKGFINELTDGGWDRFTAFASDTLPDMFSNLREVMSTIYTNVDNFLNTGNVEDLFKDANGENLFDVKALTEKALQWAAVGTSYFLFGPLGAIKSAMTASLLNTVEEVTGFDIDDRAEAALTTLMGMPGSGRLAARGALTAGRIIASMSRSAIGMAVRLVAINPIAALAIGAGVLVAWGVGKMRETLAEYNATQAEADRMLADAKAQASINSGMIDPLNAEGVTVAEDTNSGMTSETNRDQLNRAVAGLLPMVSSGIRDDDGDMIMRKLTFDELTPEEQTNIMNRALENIKPHLEEQFQNLVNNQSMYWSFAEMLADGKGTQDSLDQLRYFLEQAKIEADQGNEGAASAYNTIIDRIQKTLAGRAFSDIDESSSQGFSDLLRELGFQEGFSPDSLPMLDMNAVINDDRLGQVTNDVFDGHAAANMMIMNGGNSVRQGDNISTSSIQIITPSSGSSLSNAQGIPNSFA